MLSCSAVAVALHDLSKQAVDVRFPATCALPVAAISAPAVRAAPLIIASTTAASAISTTRPSESMRIGPHSGWRSRIIHVRVGTGLAVVQPHHGCPNLQLSVGLSVAALPALQFPLTKTVPVASVQGPVVPLIKARNTRLKLFELELRPSALHGAAQPATFIVVVATVATAAAAPGPRAGKLSAIRHLPYTAAASTTDSVGMAEPPSVRYLQAKHRDDGHRIHGVRVRTLEVTL